MSSYAKMLSWLPQLASSDTRIAQVRFGIDLHLLFIFRSLLLVPLVLLAPAVVKSKSQFNLEIIAFLTFMEVGVSSTHLSNPLLNSNSSLRLANSLRLLSSVILMLKQLRIRILMKICWCWMGPLMITILAEILEVTSTTTLVAMILELRIRLLRRFPNPKLESPNPNSRQHPTG
jgi:hypothetical protein